MYPPVAGPDEAELLHLDVHRLAGAATPGAAQHRPA
jgi:hypothetical protein